MKLGLSYANTALGVDPQGAVAVGRAAEEAGFDSLWTVEHVVVPAGYESVYPYSSSGKMAGGDDVSIPAPLIWLAYVAARTSTIKLATGVLILPQHNPVTIAKDVATLDVLSGGRVILGVGVGWLKEEFDVLRAPFDERGRRTDEYVDVMRTLWRDDEPSFHGDFYRFDDARMWPKPVHRSVPIIVGGHTEAAARRAGRIGDGFFPGRARPEQLSELIRVMREAAHEAGRDPNAIEITAAARPDPERIDQLRELGVARVTVTALGFEIEEVKRQLAAAADAVKQAAAF